MQERTIGIIGLGIMGSAVSGNLLQDGFDVIGYDVLIERVRALEARGGRGATSVRAVADEAPVIISLLPSMRALGDVVSGDKGLVRAGRAGSVLLECSTLPLDGKEAARRALERVSIVVLDCPLSGTGAQAVTRDLVVYASGDQSTFERCAGSSTASPEPAITPGRSATARGSSSSPTSWSRSTTWPPPRRSCSA